MTAASGQLKCPDACLLPCLIFIPPQSGIEARCFYVCRRVANGYACSPLMPFSKAFGEIPEGLWSSKKRFLIICIYQNT
jgi:hypothetical protein